MSEVFDDFHLYFQELLELGYMAILVWLRLMEAYLGYLHVSIVHKNMAPLVV